MLLSGCDDLPPPPQIDGTPDVATLPQLDLPGRPKKEDKWQPPSAEKNFTKLYEQNCRGCHGLGSLPGPGLALDNQVFLAVVPRGALIGVIAAGIHGTAMPGFSVSNGGPLTDEQVAIVADGLLALRKPDFVLPADAPAYSAPLGNPAKGAEVFAAIGGTASSGILNPSYLSLVSNQSLRTTFLAGRPDFGIPDYRNHPSGKVLTSQDLSDLVAWLASQRPAGSRLSATTTPSAQP
jgi:mono/diheme cytochrome c family protein